jgi:hypothetical protein
MLIDAAQMSGVGGCNLYVMYLSNMYQLYCKRQTLLEVLETNTA